MPKISAKLKLKIANQLRPVVDEVGKQLYQQLDVVINKMNIDIGDIFDCSTDYNQFWTIVSNYYNDYIVEEDNENASN